MKKISYLLAGLLLCLSTSVFAEDHLAEATKHANEAVSEGHAGSAPKMMHHAKAALDHSLAASIVAKSVPKNHINAASKHQHVHRHKAHLSTNHTTRGSNAV